MPKARVSHRANRNVLALSPPRARPAQPRRQAKSGAPTQRASTFILLPKVLAQIPLRMDSSAMTYKRTTPRAVLRRLFPSDQAEIRAHFIRLDAPTRRARFFGSVSDGGIAKYADGIFRQDSILCGAFIDAELRGLVELRGVTPFWGSTAEAAFSVEPDWQNMGLGDALFDSILAIAQNRGVKTIRMLCLKENIRMQHLAAKHRARLDYDKDTVEAVLHPRWPSPISMAKEWIGSAGGYSRTITSLKDVW